ncbi:MAG: chorismate synthase [Bacteroides sp.]|nr:chorismate synthase [Bacteroides sp.]MCM1379087.1 chorismate synthase [Bacteroides sp.]MCM1445785.1 chorismate synthase [Prevotella sp.]
MNTFGNKLTLTTFGESHGTALGGVIDGFPAGFPIDMARIQSELDRRRPGQSHITTQRSEPDCVEILSGIFEGRTLGTPIGFIIRNTNQRSADYEEMRSTFRPSHADFTYQAKYGVRDYRGGGRASARETAARVVGGAFCRQWLESRGVEIHASTVQVGDIRAAVSTADPESNAVRCADPEAAERMIRLIEEVKAAGDTIGGVIECRILGVPAGVGEPLFDRLNSRLGAAMLTIPAVKGVEFGMGFEGCTHRGSEMIDEFTTDPNGRIITLTNNSGGIQGGISNGMPITFRVGFKPVATLLRDVNTVDADGNPTVLHARGRHDACVLPRAVPVVEAMAALTLSDLWCS